MPFPLLFALFLAFGFETTSSSPPALPLARTELWPRVLETLAGVFGVGAFAFIYGRLILFRLKRENGATSLVRKAYRMGNLAVNSLSVVVFGLLIFDLEWPRVVRSGLGVGDPVLLDDALILLPFLVMQFLGWWGVYPAERALRVYRGIDSTVAGGLGRYLWLKARQSLGMVLPVAIVYGLGTDLIHRRWPSTASSPWDQPAGLIVMGFLVLIAAPLLVRIAWPTRSLPPGPLRDRLEHVAHRVGFKCTDILIWETNSLIVNAGVTGSLPWFRYVFLTDALIEELTPFEIAAVFGHEIGHIAHRHLVFFGFFILGSLGVLALAGAAISEILRALPLPAVSAPGTTGAFVLESALTLVVVGGYFFFVFGYLSRRFEGQADVFGCRVVSCGRDECPPHSDLDGYSAETSSKSLAPLCPVGTRIFISALETVASRNGMKPRAWSWRHGSIFRRIAFLESLIETPGAERHFQSRVRRMRWVMGLFLALGAGLAVAMAAE